MQAFCAEGERVQGKMCIRDRDYPIEGVEVNRPVEPQVIERVEAELFGQDFGEPVRVENPELPPCWK